MEKINQSVSVIFTWSIILSLFLAAGLPLIIAGAVIGNWGMLGTGIAFVVIGFYGCPLCWCAYGNKLGYKRIVFAVVKEKIYSIEKIASHLNIKPQIALDRLDTCIRNGFLVGYIREGDCIRPNVKYENSYISYKCVSCGATFEVLDTALPKCPYCSTINE